MAGSHRRSSCQRMKAAKMMALVIDQGNQCYKLVVVVIVSWVDKSGCLLRDKVSRVFNAALTNTHQSSCQPSTGIPIIISWIQSHTSSPGSDF